ncbi:MAG: hypothetical protein VX796_09115 [Pseudomonadota bacterium]|nr:hypothetical protein [Pseudomonadota bacterium]
MPSTRPLAAPSDLFFAIGDALLAEIPEIAVGNYDEFDTPERDATVLIEFERTRPATRGNDGRYAHDFTITLHAVVGRWRRWAPLEAVNLATAVERVVDSNRWGLPSNQCDPPDPETMHNSPSIFQTGKHGYEAWGVTFNQTIYLGESWAPEDPVTVAAPLVAHAWQVDTSDPGNYQPLTE